MPRASFRLEMLQVARLAPKLLGESADLVGDFLSAHLDRSGGFVNRGGKPDLYYTVFGVEAMLALHREPPKEQISPWLKTFDLGENLDFIHLCSLARVAASLGGDVFSAKEKKTMVTLLA